MAAKKTSTKQAKATKPKAGKKQFLQTDDPIIIKPGGSISIEFDDTFSRQPDPSNHRRKHRHPTASQLTQLVINYTGGAQDRFNLAAGDWVQICYTGSKCP